MQSLREALASVLRDLRREYGLSLRQLAAKAAMSPTYLGEVERGLKEPSSESLTQLAAGLGVALPNLLYRVADRLSGEDRPSAEAGEPGEGGETRALEATVRRLARELDHEDLYALARFGEFLLDRRDRAPDR